MSKTAFLVIDVQRDFTEGGTLGCAGGRLAAHRLRDLVAGGSYPLTISSQDWHTPGEDNGGHFALTTPPNYTTTWPVHCEAGTPGASYEEPLEEGIFTYRILKGQGKPAYSAFEGVEVTTGEELTALLQREEVTAVVLAGIALDHCVKATALDAVAAGFPTTVLVDLCPSVTQETAQEALTELEKAGVKLSTSSQEGGA